MTGPMSRHEVWDELISASLNGDLTADERRRLDAHLDTCERCRATLAAFADTRRLVAGLRHVAPPRDLGARVRAGIEYANVPWWRRPAMIFTAVGGGLAAVTGALLALVLLNGNPSGPQVGQASPTQPAVTPAPSVSTQPGATPPTATLPPPTRSRTPRPSRTSTSRLPAPPTTRRSPSWSP